MLVREKQKDMVGHLIVDALVSCHEKTYLQGLCVYVKSLH